MSITITLFSYNAVLRYRVVLAVFSNISPLSAFRIKERGETKPCNKLKRNKDCIYPIDHGTCKTEQITVMTLLQRQQDDSPTKRATP